MPEVVWVPVFYGIWSMSVRYESANSHMKVKLAKMILLVLWFIRIIPHGVAWLKVLMS
jgi:hypothetical protein